MPFLAGGLLQREFNKDAYNRCRFYALSSGRSIATQKLTASGKLQVSFYALSSGRSIAT